MSPCLSRLWALPTLLLAITWVFGPLAWALPPPKHKPVLTVSGKIGQTNQNLTAVWDMAMLEALPQRNFTTRTPWDNAPVRFSGPLLRDVLAAMQSQGSLLKATALNDYRINIPIGDTERFDVIMAIQMNDQPMPIRSKGPLFIVYPFDSLPELRSTTYYERSIWQLKSIEIE